MSPNHEQSSPIHHVLRVLADQLAAAGIKANASVMIHPTTHGDTAAVDQIAQALGLVATNQSMSNGAVHRTVTTRRGPVEVTVLTAITEPAQLRRARLAAELDELDKQIEVSP